LSGRPIRWLHLSDLHLGCPGKALWWAVANEFEESVKEYVTRLGRPDLVLFTGDLAFKGDKDEFSKVNQFLGKLLEWIGEPAPLIVPVPGNHDLARPQKLAVAPFRLLDKYHLGTDDEDIKNLIEAVWTGKEPNSSFFEPLFGNFQAWFKDRIEPQFAGRADVKLHRSHFPGDFSLVLDLPDTFPITVVGLNSAWMQYNDKEFERKLELPIEQFRASLPADGAEILQKSGNNLLLMHHPSSWLRKKAEKEFLENVFLPTRFALCLHGHAHELRGLAISMDAGDPRYSFQAPSLFGLEHYGSELKETRVFGYSWGQMSENGEVRVWPLERKVQGSVPTFVWDQKIKQDDAGAVIRPLLNGRIPMTSSSAPRTGFDIEEYRRQLAEATAMIEFRPLPIGDEISADNAYIPLRIVESSASQSVERARPSYRDAIREEEDKSREDDSPRAWKKRGQGEADEVHLQEKLIHDGDLIREKTSILVEGPAGCGKSTLCQRLAHVLATRFPNVLPVLVRARDTEKPTMAQPPEAAATQLLTRSYVQQGRKVQALPLDLASDISKGNGAGVRRVVLLLDGIDEATWTAQTADYLSATDRIQVIATARPGTLLPWKNHTKWNRYPLRIAKLDHSGVTRLVSAIAEKQGVDPRPVLWKIRSGSLPYLGGNPLLLTLSTCYFLTSPDRLKTDPSMTDFYSSIVRESLVSEVLRCRDWSPDPPPWESLQDRLGELALKALIPDHDENSDVRPLTSEVRAGLSGIIPPILQPSGSERLAFVHLSFAEYLAAHGLERLGQAGLTKALGLLKSRAVIRGGILPFYAGLLDKHKADDRSRRLHEELRKAPDSITCDILNLRARCLSQSGDKAAIRKMLEWMDPWASVSCEARILTRDKAWEIAQALRLGLGDQQIGEEATDQTSMIAALLNSPDAHVRANAARELKVLASKAPLSHEAVCRLLALLKDRDEDVRHAAIRTLGATGSGDGVRALVAMLQEGDASDRTTVAEALGRTRSSEAVPGLLAALRDPYEDVQKAAATSLGKIGSATAVSGLLGILGKVDPSICVSNAAAKALIGIGRCAEATKGLLDLLNAPVMEVRDRAIQILGEFRSHEAVPHFIGLLREEDIDCYTKEYLIEALGKTGTRESVEFLVGFLRSAGDGYWQRLAGKALQRIGTTDAVSGLIGSLSNSNHSVRFTSVEILGESGEMKSVPALLGRLDDPDPEVRRKAAWALGKIRSTAAIPGLLGLLRERESNQQVMVAIIEALGQIGSREGASAVARLLDSPESDIRYAARECLRTGFRGLPRNPQTGEPLGGSTASEDVSRLVVFLDNADSYVRADAAVTLGQIGCSTAVQKLLTKLDDDSAYVRFSVVGALGWIESEDRTPGIVAALRDPHSTVAGTAAEVLARVDRNCELRQTPKPYPLSMLNYFRRRASAEDLFVDADFAFDFEDDFVVNEAEALWGKRRLRSDAG